MPSLSSSIKYGMLTWQIVSAVADSTSDQDRNPDAKTIPGLKATFIPSIKRVKDLNSPMTIFLEPISALFDNEGYMLGGDGKRGVSLVASDSPAVGSDQLTYSMVLTGTGIQTQTFTVRVLADTTYDLTQAVI